MKSEFLEKIQSGRQYRNMEIRIAEDNQESEYKVKGYATTFNEPYVLMTWDDMEIREQVDPGAFADADMSDVIMQYDHEGRVFARLKNKTMDLTVDEHGLLVNADLGGTEIGRQLYEEIKGGYTDKMSFGFTVKEDRVEEFDEGDKRIYLRTIVKVGKLYDVSAVSIPANDGTEISARAFCDGVIAKREAERLLAEKNKRDRDYIELKTKILKCGGK